MKRSVPLLAMLAFALSLAFPAGAAAAAGAGVGSVDATAFSQARAMAHVTTLTAFGVRKEGSPAEGKAVSYCIETLKGFGYTVSTMPFKLPNGAISRNVIAAKAGRSGRQIMFGAHLDSKPPSPGGNDNGSGVGTVLELARALKDADIEPTVVFVLFGSEEMSDSNPDHHHYGSRTYAAKLTVAQRKKVSAMISVDMVGYGPYFYARTMGVGPQTVQSRLRTYASAKSIYLRYLKDSSRYGSSDHEAFERAGVPVTWLEWRSDPYYHTAKDTAAHVQPFRMLVTGTMLSGWVTAMTASDLIALRP